MTYTTGAHRPRPHAHIEVMRATKIYLKPDGGRVVAVGDLDLSVRQGNFVAIVGSSGCGKSTLLKLIAGLITPDRGTITIGSQPAAEGRRDVGILLQTPTLLPWKNVLANVLLPYEIRKEKSPELKELALSTLDTVGLGGFARNYPWQLSGGMQQRVALARLLVAKPEVALLDEPFGALDEITREALNLELRDLHNRIGSTTVLITHSVEEAAFLADEVVVMAGSPGRVVGTVAVDLPSQRGSELLRADALHAAIADARQLLEAVPSPHEAQAGRRTKVSNP
ncbi:ABC transporter ATP-binding protein [Euzebya tangerina]|uniref:ABC transporter ATP-binding protein n=1 Tax=Euzebya tangerina TaxID=591198 RepID=UPI000E31DD2E|nr:ABC transporter ATP-binding protein [Euzebya tangerina]